MTPNLLKSYSPLQGLERASSVSSGKLEKIASMISDPPQVTRPKIIYIKDFLQDLLSVFCLSLLKSKTSRLCSCGQQSCGGGWLWILQFLEKLYTKMKCLLFGTYFCLYVFLVLLNVHTLLDHAKIYKSQI